MLEVRVRSITFEAERIRSFELVRGDGGELPSFEPGAHIDVAVVPGVIRQYSLCDPHWQRHHYRIAVLEELEGRGGSRALHEAVRAGDYLQISEPRNHFGLAAQARHTILLAGGIGITPILSMMQELVRRNESFELHYCTESRQRTPFIERLAPLVASASVHVHHDQGDPARRLDFTHLLDRFQEGTNLYYCGPPGFMNAVRTASAHWPIGNVHFEHFNAGKPLPVALANSGEFAIRLHRSGNTVRAAPEQSILVALRNAGVSCNSSCEAGVCGTCRVRYLSGRAQHNDHVLSDEERLEYMLVCCARAVDDSLVLDL